MLQSGLERTLHIGAPAQAAGADKLNRVLEIARVRRAQRQHLCLAIEEHEAEMILRPKRSEKSFESLIAALQLFPLHGKRCIEQNHDRLGGDGLGIGARCISGRSRAFPEAEQRFRFKEARLVRAAWFHTLESEQSAR